MLVAVPANMSAFSIVRWSGIALAFAIIFFVSSFKSTVAKITIPVFCSILCLIALAFSISRVLP
jgi:hypothetical protein